MQYDKTNRLQLQMKDFVQNMTRTSVQLLNAPGLEQELVQQHGLAH